MSELTERVETLRDRRKDAAARLGAVDREYDGVRDGAENNRDEQIGALTSERNTLESELGGTEAELRELEAGLQADRPQAEAGDKEAPSIDAEPAPSNQEVSEQPQAQGSEQARNAPEANPAPDQPIPAGQTEPTQHDIDSVLKPPDGQTKAPTTADRASENKGFGPFEPGPATPDGFDAQDVNRNPTTFAGLPNAEMGNFPGEWSRKKDEDFFKPVDGKTPEDWERVATEKALHERQLSEINEMKGQIVEQMDAAKAEMGKLDLNSAQQHEFQSYEFSNAFDRANRLFAAQDQEMAALQANNLSEHPAVREAQMENRADMEQEMHAYRWGMTRELAQAQAVSDVEFSNGQMADSYRTRLESEQAPPDRMQAQMDSLHQIQAEQFPSDVYSQTNQIQNQRCPEIAQRAPSMDAPGVGAAAAAPPGMAQPFPPPQNQGPTL